MIFSVFILFAVLPFSFNTAQASEPLFGYLYTTDILPKGRWELEQLITDREGQAHEDDRYDPVWIAKARRLAP